MSIEMLPLVASDPETTPEAAIPALPRNNTSSLLRNSGYNLLRLGLTAVVSVLLPTFLTHHLPVKVYGAWVLILQLSAYVAYLNFGVQTAVSKYIAEYEAQGDLQGCGRAASAGLRIMLVAAGLALLLTVTISVCSDRLFRDVPPDLLRDVRWSVLIVGVSLSMQLASSLFSAIFLGLQRYEIPTCLGVISRFLYGAAVCTVVLMHRGLIVMAVATAAINLLASAGEVVAWRWRAAFIPVRLRGVDGAMLRRMLGYCSILTIWSMCMLFITGLDLTIVGHFAFGEVAFYSIASAPTNMILLLVGSLLGPLLPATSALSVRASPLRLGEVLLRSTRYSTILLLLTGVPVLVGGYPLLRLWVGPIYAVHSIVFLHLLLIANIIRNLGAPYSTMVVALSRQRVGTVSAITEGVVNLVCSILLARRLGAMGVALGTLIGSVAGLALHFAVTMHYTRVNLAITRAALFFRGIVRPSILAVPSLLLAGRWWSAGVPAMSARVWMAWALSTGVLTWFVSFTPEDRTMAARLLRSRSLAALRQV